jgi:dolichol-phosphate mannosyltransferase
MNNFSVSIIYPTLNEENNVRELYLRISSALECRWELIFVDDNSSDNTRQEIENLCVSDSRVRLISIFDRKGLASAASEGFLSSIYKSIKPYICTHI